MCQSSKESMSSSYVAKKVVRCLHIPSKWPDHQTSDDVQTMNYNIHQFEPEWG
jgi:hypothetical protein